MIDTSDVEYFPTAIVGAGCTGLTLAHELINSKDFPCILLDPQKFRPEHAFSFWEYHMDAFDMGLRDTNAIPFEPCAIPCETEGRFGLP